MLGRKTSSIMQDFAPGYLNFLFSCAAVLENNLSNVVFGYFFLTSYYSGQHKRVYCDMKDPVGGWMRVAKLDVQNCPLELRQKTFKMVV